jgi:hypothetical protein
MGWASLGRTAAERGRERRQDEPLGASSLSHADFSTRVRAERRSVVELILGPVNLLLVALFSCAVVGLDVVLRPAFAWDFRPLYLAGHDYLHLHSPYVAGTLAQLTSQNNFVYPLPIAALFAPISLVPYTLAAVLFVAMSAVCLVLAVWVLGVRDWRCYAAVLIGMPALGGIGLGTISPLLTLLLAALWRFRDRDRAAVPILSLIVVAKLFLWPVGLWLLLTRRFRTVAAATIVSAAAVIASALPIGLGALTHYPALLRSLSAFDGPLSMSLTSLVTNAGGAPFMGTVLAGAVGLALLLGMVRASRRGDDSLTFRLAIVAALALSPIVWNHYLLVLVVPLALTRPRFSAVWLGSAWMMLHGALMDRVSLAIFTVAVWVVIVIQSGILRGSVVGPESASRLFAPVTAFLESVALWVGLVALVVVIAGAVPGIAALTPRTPTSSASGTALVRMSRKDAQICWRIQTAGLPARARAEIFETGRARMLMERPLRDGRSEACSHYGSRTPNDNLARAYQTGRVDLKLAIVSPDGRDLLAGPVVVDMRDLGRTGPQRDGR